MAENDRKLFHIATPDLRTVYLGNGRRQKARFLKLHENFGRKQLDEDIETGAVIYASFPDTLKLGGTQYNLITAPSEEDGLRAVVYLAGIHAESMGYADYDLSEPYSEDPEFTEEDFRGAAEETFDLDDLYEDGSEEYSEEFDRIPVITMNEVMAEENRNRPTGGFGVFNMELQNSASREDAWWKDCTEQSVCIVKKNFFDSGEFLPDFGNELLDPSEIESLRRFSENEKVYVVIVEKDIRENDLSLTSAVLEYTADLFRIDNKKASLMSYYRRLLEDAAVKYGFEFCQSVDLNLLSEKLSQIDKDHPCREFEKIMEYMIHMGASRHLDGSSFDGLGLRKLIEKAVPGGSIGTLERELVGMESVKKQVNNVMNMLRYVRLRASRNIENSRYHNVHLFLGAPGTAKTTVAKIMANMMRNEGLLKGNRFISLTGAEMKGAFVGQTAPKVHALFQQYDAIFIDEAYSLACGSEDAGGPDLYSREALAQLAVELEEHATDKLVIFAGYGGKSVSGKNNLMNQFLRANPGISSRINSTVYFDSYTPEDMAEIVHHLAKQASLSFPEDQDSALMAYFRTRQNEDDFGNGREARVFLEYCERFIAERVSGRDPVTVSDTELNTVTAEDVKNTIEALRKKREDELGRSGRKLGFA